MKETLCILNTAFKTRLYFYFSEHKLRVEIGEYGQADRDFEYKQSRQLMIESKLGCRPIRTDPNAAYLNIYRQINQVRIHIK